MPQGNITVCTVDQTTRDYKYDLISFKRITNLSLFLSYWKTNF